MFQSFEEYINASSMQVPILSFIINLLIAATLAIILRRLYIAYGTSLSNRSLFSRNFLLLTMTTMLIISIVKSSLALSLGLVGALSIIRFRAAIKEPEELAYLFLSISIGLGLGANQGLITIIAFTIITTIVVLTKKLSFDAETNQNLYLTISTQNPEKINADKIIEILKEYCLKVHLRRLDETKDIIELAFLIEFDNFQKLNDAKVALQSIDESLVIKYLDNKEVI